VVAAAKEWLASGDRNLDSQLGSEGKRIHLRCMQCGLEEMLAEGCSRRRCLETGPAEILEKLAAARLGLDLIELPGHTIVVVHCFVRPL